MANGENPEGLIDLGLAKSAVTDEEIMHDMDKELEGIFRKREQKEKALELITLLSLPHLKEGLNQKRIAENLHIDEMAASRLIKELEEHGHVKRTSRPVQIFGGEEKMIQMNW